MNNVKVAIELSKSDIEKLEYLTGMILLDEDGYISDDEISDAVSILISNI